MKKLGFFAAVVAASLFIASSLPSSPPMEELEGTLEIIMSTEIGKKSCEPLYFINVNGKRTQFSLPARIPPLSPGQKIKIAGRWEESDSGKKSFHCRKVKTAAVAPVAKKSVSATDSASYLPKQTPVLGKRRTLVFLLRFTNQNTPGWGKNEAEKKVFSSNPTDEYPNDHSVNAFLKECSLKKTWLDGECLDGWKDMLYPATDYGYGSDGELDFLNELETDAINVADPYINYTEYDHVLFVRTGHDWRYDFSTLGKKTLETGDGEVNLSFSFVTQGDIALDNSDIALDSDYVTHELVIHGILGLIHANSIDVSTGGINEYGDQWDNRGAQYTLIDCLHKYMAGLLGIDQIQIVDASGEYWLDQRELGSDGTNKLLIIFLGYDENGESILYYLEYFKELGEFDSRVFDDYNPDENKDVVLLRKYKKENTYDSVVYVTDGKGGFNIKALDLESQEFCDSDYENLEHYGVCVQVLEKTGEDSESKAKVKITLTEDYNQPSPTPNPTPSPTPEPTPTPSPSPAPTLAPTPTPTLEEMAMSVSLNKKLVRRGGKTRKIRVEVEARDTDGSLVEADKVFCKMTRSDGTWLQDVKINTSKPSFSFKIRSSEPVGRYKISATASKKGYLDATAEKFFKVK